jgi:uncharacterized Zn-binding protein involved in type VI secretion
MPEVIRESDMNVVFGVVMPKTGALTVLIEGMPAAMKGRTQVMPHPGFGPIPHPPNPIAMGDPTVLVEGMPLAFKGVPDMCLHPMMLVGAITVLAGGSGMA